MIYKEIFEETKSRIDLACAANDFRILELLDLGFKKEDVKDGRLMHLLFILGEGDNEKIEIDFRSYDQSGPFQNLPDMNKFTANYIQNNQVIDTYQNTYED